MKYKLELKRENLWWADMWPDDDDGDGFDDCGCGDVDVDFDDCGGDDDGASIFAPSDHVSEHSEEAVDQLG